jgi:hypothetical protein
MARTAKDLEAYLSSIGRSFESTDGGTIVLAPVEGQPSIGVRAEDPVVFTAEIGSAPKNDPPTEARLFRRLLELNASDLLYTAYGLRDGTIVLSSAHPLQNLDLNEVEGILSDFDLALARHVEELLALSGGAKAEG